ncbi:peptidase S8/S53 domain-containing protein [Crucibulum laeve]|uniref:tripeptidyl-peptidase II n=1 Tax=Crucibulum laeve TaxID=68775 RepID=A0A5C3MKU8_9AGAR|nr:peptidase S8/S53 domain-containing protein [Crucibulum laeve]
MAIFVTRVCVLIAGLSCLTFLEARPSSPYIQHEKRSHIPPGWSHLRKPDASTVIPLRFALKQSNIDKLDQMLQDVSHPESANYGQYWSPAQIRQTFAPSSTTVDTVRDWLLSSGVSAHNVRLTSSKTWIEAKISMEDAERLLQAEYQTYGHETGKEHIACTSYHLPAHISPHIDVITPSIHFDATLGRRDSFGSSHLPQMLRQPRLGTRPKMIGEAQSDVDDCATQITPACLKALYNFTYNPVSSGSNTFGIVVEYTPQAYTKADLNLFARNFSSNLIGKYPKLVSVDGGIVQSEALGFQYNIESNLDLEYAQALVGPKQEITLYQVGDMVISGSFNNFLDALDGSYCDYEGGDDPTYDSSYPDTDPDGYNGAPSCGITKPANVISTSYGYNEADLSPAYTARQCAEYAKLGLMGVTFVFSSGDSGVAGNGNLCLNPDGSQTVNGTIFNPGFPATCPYITSVGATQIKDGAGVTDPEISCEETIATGGGFSNRFEMPSYQQQAVNNYLAKYKPDYSADIWNSTGISRGYPDISANGASYVVAVNGTFARVSGTSASGPVVASMLAMINDARIASGKGPIGFINPVLYSSSFSSAFNDITTGGNLGCGTAGFTTAPGWDPATGLGTPNFPKLLEKWLALP